MIGARVRRLCSEIPPGLTAYGEMVDILAAQGNLIGAERLESFWNDLAAECSFRLLCGYSSSYFCDARRLHHLDRICAHHTNTDASAGHLPGSWLPVDGRPRSHVETP